MYQIYSAYCKPSGKVYVGQTSRTTDTRWKQHLSAARQGDSAYFYNAVRKYGAEEFEVQTIAEVETKADADNLERLWILCLRSAERGHGYNGTFGGDAPILTPETKARIGASKVGRKFPKLSLAKTGSKHHLYGKHLSSEHRRKIGDSHRGVKNHNYGKPIRENVKAALSASRKGKPAPNKGKPSNRPDVTIEMVADLYKQGLSGREITRRLSHLKTSRDTVSRRIHQFLKDHPTEVRKHVAAR